MSEAEKFRCHFNVEGNVPKIVFETFAVAQAKLTGVHVWLEENVEGEVRGFIEGNRDTIAKMRTILLKSCETLGNISKIIFDELKNLKDYAEKTFEENSKDAKPNDIKPNDTQTKEAAT